jgi:hypothetical protein
MNLTDSPHARFEATEGVLFQEMEEDVVLLNIETQQYFGLDYVGARVWNMLLDKSDLDTVARRIGADFGVEIETVRADVRNLVTELVESGLLVPVAG